MNYLINQYKCFFTPIVHLNKFFNVKHASYLSADKNLTADTNRMQKSLILAKYGKFGGSRGALLTIKFS